MQELTGLMRSTELHMIPIYIPLWSGTLKEKFRIQSADIESYDCIDGGGGARRLTATDDPV